MTASNGLAGLLLALLCAGAAHAQDAPPRCGPLTSSYGPYDYRTGKADLAVVEAFHFTPEVEQLIRGKSGYLGQDLDYTLRTSPNHHRALFAMARYGERLKVAKVPFATYDVECYFDRAVRFRPDDTTVRMLYANYLKGQKRVPDAVRQLDYAAEAPIDSPYTHYNLGLSYFDLGVMDKALRHAHIALEMGFPRTDLKEQLVKAGRWTDPAPAPDAAASAPAPAASGVAR